jgi:hypothetical protein
MAGEYTEAYEPGRRTMIVQYRLSRQDVWRVYWHVWRHSWKMKLMQLFLFLLTLVSARSWLGEVPVPPWAQTLAAVAIASLVVAAMPLLPLLRFKPEERTLRIDPAGLATSIGRLSGNIAWTDIARITSERQCLYIVGRSGNSFAIPDAAFATDSHRAEFARLATTWWDTASSRK